MSNLFYGKAYNSKRKHKTKINGKHTDAYRTWSSMVVRCYSPKYQKEKPTYIGCTVASEWRDFQDFADWHQENKYSGKGYHLDKDLLSPSNKIYSPKTCCFIPAELNSLLTNHANARGKYPQGVSFNKRLSRFQSSMSVDGYPTHLGYFDSAQKAYQAYKEAKERHVKNKALEWANRIEWNVFSALMAWSLEGEFDETT